MKKKLTIEDEKGWKHLRDCANRSNLNPKCELCLRASLYDRSMMDDEWRRVCPECFDATSDCPFFRDSERAMNLPAIPDYLPQMSKNGVLKTKDKKARKEIKELRAEVAKLNRMLSALGKMVLNDKLVTTVEKYELFKYINA